jgi:hypothetical protein
MDGGTGPQGPPPPDGHNPIPAENRRQGTADWDISHACSHHEIEGYSPHPSVNVGESAPFAVSVQPMSTTFTWRAYRLGYYGGLGAREVARDDLPTPATVQPTCPMDGTTGLIACAWRTTFQIPTDASWTRGLYLLRLTRSDGFQSYVPFFVRDDQAHPSVLVDVAVATWEAYNLWGGESLYGDLNHVSPQWGHAFQVSFDRPYDRGNGAGQVLEYEHNLAKWLEAQGVDVGYATTDDLDQDPSLFHGPQVIIVPGHDEYWTTAIRDSMDAVVAAGTSLMLLGANAGYWQVRLGPSADGRARRVMTGYKEAAVALDPVGPQSPFLTTRFRGLAEPRPENALFGQMYTSEWNTWGVPLAIQSTDHWVFQGTGLNPGDTVFRAAGYETDREVPDNGFQPPGELALATSPMLSLDDVFGYGQMSIREQPALVFAAGGIDFTRALASEDMADPRLQRLTANILYRALGQPVPTLVTFTSPGPTIVGQWASSATVALGSRGIPGDVDGPVMDAQLRSPTAVATLPTGELLVVDVLALKLKRLSLQGEVQTVASGFDMPFAVAADGQGNAYVSELRRGVVLQVNAAGDVQTYVGKDWVYGTQDGVGTNATFIAPAGLAITGHHLYVTDLEAGEVRGVDLTTRAVTTLAKGLDHPSGVAAAPDGTVYIVETGLSRVLSLSSSGVVKALTTQGPGYVDGPLSNAVLMPFLGIAVMKDGTVAVSDPGNYRIRRISTSTGSLSTWAGTGRFGQALGDGAHTDVVLPMGLCVMNDGGLAVAETGNADVLVIRP